MGNSTLLAPFLWDRTPSLRLPRRFGQVLNTSDECIESVWGLFEIWYLLLVQLELLLLETDHRAIFRWMSKIRSILFSLLLASFRRRLSRTIVSCRGCFAVRWVSSKGIRKLFGATPFVGFVQNFAIQSCSHRGEFDSNSRSLGNRDAGVGWWFILKNPT